MAHTIPNPINESFAENLALELYGLSGKAKLLVGEYDHNFHLKTADAEFVLKVMHPAADRAVVEMQVAALEHLAQKAPELKAQRVQKSKSGRSLETITAPDGERLVWLLSYVPGRLYAEAKPQTPELLESLGKVLAQFDKALLDFSHPAAVRTFKWDLSKAEWVAEHLNAVEDSGRRKRLEAILHNYQTNVQPSLAELRTSVIHNDANDYNLVVEGTGFDTRVSSLIDLGDMLHNPLVNEVAIAAAYALMGQTDSIDALRSFLKGYQAALPLEDKELRVLLPLIEARLMVSVVNSAMRKQQEPDNAYIVISEKPAWDLLEQLEAIHPRMALYRIRAACGLEPVPGSNKLVETLKRHAADFAPVVPQDLRLEPWTVLDLSPNSDLYSGDPRKHDLEGLTERIWQQMKDAGVQVSIGRYEEPRLIYTTPAFARSKTPTAERRTYHMALDLFADAGTPLSAPLEGTVHAFANNAAPLDYGPVIALKHELEGQVFYTLWGHLSEESLEGKKVGQKIAKGEVLAWIGAPPINGNWPPHVHLQIMLDDLDVGHDFPGVAYPSQREVFRSLCPDPNLLVGVPAERFPKAGPSVEVHLERRRARLGRNLSISYKQPIRMVRGWMQYMFDDQGQRYLDMYNNVPHVGHNHPRVVEAVQRQFAKLNTNTRYLNDQLLEYADKLTTTLPEPLSVVFLTASGSEANELALRLARAYTGKRDMVVMTSGYHGHTTSMIDLSQYKFDGPGGQGAPEWVHLVPVADDYRGEFKRGDPQAGEKYASSVKEAIAAAQAKGREIAGFICESIPSVGGQIVLPEGYLAKAYEHVRAAGAVCIADEVQTGFGRIGTHFWAFEQYGVTPDIVVMGKPIGNGFPMGAVVTTPEIADAFNNGMEFFSTFGGTNSAVAAGLAVLNVTQEEGLQQHALEVGNHLLKHLKPLVDRYPIVGDVRGSGLFLGIELVRDRATLEPANREASYIANRMRQHGILLGTDGPYHNVVKMRGPMPFSLSDANFFLEVLEGILQEDALTTD